MRHTATPPRHMRNNKFRRRSGNASSPAARFIADMPARYRHLDLLGSINIKGYRKRGELIPCELLVEIRTEIVPVI